MKISNILTLSRIGMVLIALFFASVSHTQYPVFYPFFDLSPAFVTNCHIVALLLGIVAALTDFFDGYLARKLQQVTDFGALMDPLADKVVITTYFLVFVYYDFIPAWIAVVILSREFLVTGLRALAAKKGIVMAADRWGKIKTLLQMTILLLAGLAWVGWLPVDLITPSRDFEIVRFIWHVSLWAITFITVASGVSYFVKYKELYCRDW